MTEIAAQPVTHPDHSAKVQTFTQAMSPGQYCDRCGATAYLTADMPNGSALHFCSHHAREHYQALTKAAVLISDYRPCLEAMEAAAR